MKPTSRVGRIALAAIFAAALALRCWGIAFGLPLWSNYYIRPDESLIVEPALRPLEDPRFVNYPALMSLLSGVVFASYHAAARVVSDVPPALALHAADDFGTFFVLVRLVSAVVGAAAVFPVFLSARAIAGPAAGLIGAMLIALSPLAVREAHYAVTDTLLMALVALVFWRTVTLPPAPSGPTSSRRTSRGRALLVLGISSGLMVSAKYTGVFLAPAVLAGVLLTADRRRWLADAARVAVVAAVTFAVINPFLLLHARDVLETARLLFYASFQRSGASGEWNIASGFLNLWRPLSHGPALWLGMPLAIAGTVVTLRDPGGRTRGIVGLMACLGFGGALFFAHVVPHRYVLPVTPIVAVFAAVAFAAPRDRRLGAVLALGLGAVTVFGAWRSMKHDRLLAQEDTRASAGRWIQTHVPVDCPIAMWAAPETEAQIRESAASIERRIEFVHHLYGAGAGVIIDRPYRLAQVAAARNPAGRYDVFRSTMPPTDARCVAVVVAGYPGFSELDRSKQASFAANNGAPTAHAVFSPFGPGFTTAAIEPFDAFFLPIDHLDRVTRPGPIVEVTIWRALRP